MKLNCITPRLTLSWVHGSFLLIFLMGGAGAGQAFGRSQDEQKPGIFQRASDNIGGFFHQLFNPNEAPPPPPQRNQRTQRGTTPRPGGPHNNLDEAPTGETPSMPKGSPSQTPGNTKNPTNSTKPSTSKNQSGEVQDVKSSKSKSSTTTQEKKEVVVKSKAPTKKTNPENNPVRDTTAISNSTSETKSTGKTENTTEPKISQEQSVLTGSKTSKVGRVKSPYPPYNELDVSGLSTGSLALDPTTQKVFRVP